MIYLNLEELFIVGEHSIGTAPQVRDVGLLESALSRPASSAFGEDAYATLHLKAAALTHSLARNHALIDGNKRLALGGLIAFLGLNGRRLTFTNDEAYDFIMKIAQGHLDEVSDIAAMLDVSTIDWK